MPTTKPTFEATLLFAAIPRTACRSLRAALEPVELVYGQVLYEPLGQIRFVYFPLDSLVSLLTAVDRSRSLEVGMVGNEGMVGISLFMGGNTTPSSAMVLTAGHAYRIERRLLKQEFDRAGPLLRLLLRYTQTLITQMSQTAVCNRHHTVEQQLCRWLLMTVDRIPSGQLTMTQELVAGMLGVRREGVTEAAGNLQRDGLIRYRRGHIEVIDRAGLGKAACECYSVVKHELDRLLTDIPHGDPFHVLGQSSG